MKLRPYCDSNDYPYIEKWVDGERVHALWCAGLVPYPLSRKNFLDFLDKDAKEWGGKAYMAIQEDGLPVGFYIYSHTLRSFPVSPLEKPRPNSGFLKFVICDNALRGKGLGRQMISLALEHAFTDTTISFVQLNVFDVNEKAISCYKNAGFAKYGLTENAFRHNDEQWGRYNMRITYTRYNSLHQQGTI